MVEIKSLSSPKVAIPVVGILVLVVVSTLVAMFYIRNPTVTDGLFGGNNDETTSASSVLAMQSGDLSTEHVTSSSIHSDGQSAHLVQSTTSGAYEQPSTTTSSAAATLPVTSAPDQVSTPMHAIEPVQHL
ncbi:unnamed protein product [Caenorhabditis sp. 36 PRJEB53466]|nr:unnamed protein product [Caenorhabditis sp. 36 PRJEB53466]